MDETEADETITLTEIVSTREECLQEEELWALCRECCLTLEFVNSTQELFQSLAITPDTVAFDREGNVCFLDLDADPEPLYIPPEFDEVCSYKSHLYSLGMTLLYAVEYAGNSVEDENKAHLSEELNSLLVRLTQNNPDNRLDLEAVLELCDKALTGLSSQEICQQFASSADSCLGKDEESLLSVTEEIAAYLQNQSGLVTPAPQGLYNPHTNQEYGITHSTQVDKCVMGIKDLSPLSSNSVTTDLQEVAVDDCRKYKITDKNANLNDCTFQNCFSTDVEHQNLMSDENTIVSSRKNKRRQGLLVTAILDALHRFLQEAELWALCRESIVSLLKKKKHLPAYISPDTLMVRENGSVSYKAIPENKPLEVIFMAPELKQKGVVNEKTCVYGLGITLRFAAGKKHSTSPLDRSVGAAFQELIFSLGHINPEHRPSFETALRACDEYMSQSNTQSGNAHSQDICLQIYRDAFALLTKGNAQDKNLPPNESKLQNDIHQFTGFKPHTPEQVGSAFKPISMKPKEFHRAEKSSSESQQLPYAFSSSATHFKPIILHGSSTSSTKSEKQTPVSTKEESKKETSLVKTSEVTHSLLEHKHSSLSKDTENDDSKPLKESLLETVGTPKTPGSSNASGQMETSNTLQVLLQQLRNSGHMLDTQSLAQAIAQHLQSQITEKEVTTSPSSHSLSSQLSPVNSSQDMSPNQLNHLQVQMQGVQPGMSSNLFQQNHGQSVNFIPSGQTMVMGQTYSVPAIQLSGSLMPPQSMQYHLQQDPHTGLVQLVPVNMVYLGTQPSLQRSQTTPPNLDNGFYHLQQGFHISPNTTYPQVSHMTDITSINCQTSPNAGYIQGPYMTYLTSTNSQASPNTSYTPAPHMTDITSTNSQANKNAGYTPVDTTSTNSQASQSAGYIQASHMEVTQMRDNQGEFNNTSGGPITNSHSAKALNQKTATQKTIHTSVSPSDLVNASGMNNLKPPLHIGKPHVHHREDQNYRGSDIPDIHLAYRQSGSSYSEFLPRYSDCVDERGSSLKERNQDQTDWKISSFDTSQHISEGRVGGFSQAYRSSSQSSSPSLSKDSGISLTGNASGGQGVESSCSLHPQKLLLQVSNIVQECFTVDSPQDEETLVEYIVSLMHLKWETFVSAITEKYIDMHWRRSVLVSLYNVVNGHLPPCTDKSAKTPPATRRKSFFSEEENTKYKEKDIHAKRFSEPDFIDEKNKKATIKDEHGNIQDKFHSGENRPHRTADTSLILFGGGGGIDISKKRVVSHSSVHIPATGHLDSGSSETYQSSDIEERDAENIEKRYQLDRNKSNSLHSLPIGNSLTLSPESISLISGCESSSSDRLDTDFIFQTEGSAHHTIVPPKGQAIVKRETNKLCKTIDTLYSSSGSYVPSVYYSLPRSRQNKPPLLKDVQKQFNDGNTLSSEKNSIFRGQLLSNSSNEFLSQDSTRSQIQESLNSHQRKLKDVKEPYSPMPVSSLNPTDSSKDSKRVRNRQSHSVDIKDGNQVRDTQNYSVDIKDGKQVRDPQNLYVDVKDSLRVRDPQNHSVDIKDAKRVRDSQSQYLEKVNHNTSSKGSSPLSPLSLVEGHKESQSRPNRVDSYVSREHNSVNSVMNNNTKKYQYDSQHLINSKNFQQNFEPTVKDTGPAKLAWGPQPAVHHKKGHIVYHSAMIHLNMTSELNCFVQEIDKENKSAIESKLNSVQQEITMQWKHLRKSQTFYQKLNETSLKAVKGAGDTKVVITQVLKDMSEMTKKLSYLNLCRSHLQMLLAELYGLDPCFLHTLVSSGNGEEPLVLQPYLENHLLQFQTAQDPSTGCEMSVLHAGHHMGLLSYLFMQSALRNGYIHQFLFCFRYFAQAEEVFEFITHKYQSATKGNEKDVNIVRVQQRAVDIVQFWVEGFYSVDFERNELLLDRLESLIKQWVDTGVSGAQNIFNLLCACRLGENVELVGHCDDHSEVYYMHLLPHKHQTKVERLMEWDSFYSLVGWKKDDGKAKGKQGNAYKKGGILVRRSPRHSEASSSLSPLCRTEAMQLLDYPPHHLVEQLTLMHQDLFQRTHPVHYLNSKAQGIGVDLSIPSLRTPSMVRKRDSGGPTSMFVCTQHFESRVGDLIAHEQEITHWVSAEILTSGAEKSQVQVLIKFLTTAHLCVEIKNYGTAMAILAGLNNLLVRQLSAWKHLPTKATNFMEQLEQLQMQLKGDATSLMQDKENQRYPTIPCTLYFLLHLQQLEIGSFKLANGMYKWAKMRLITQMIDQIRIFREHSYGFEPDYELQSLMCRRLQELSCQDLHTVAAANDTNFRRATSSHITGLQSTWRRVKDKLQTKAK